VKNKTQYTTTKKDLANATTGFVENEKMRIFKANNQYGPQKRMKQY